VAPLAPRRVGNDTTARLPESVLSVLRANRHHALLLPTAAWTGAFFIAPLALLLVYSFASMDIVTFHIHFGWTLSNYGQLGNSIYLGAILRSLALSVGATLACLVLAFPVAYTISQTHGRLQTLLLVAIMIPFWTSFLIRTYAWISLLSNGGPIESVLQTLGVLHGSLNVLYTWKSIAVGIVYGYLPLMIFPLYVALERIDPQLLEAAADLGAPGFRRLRRVTIPLAMPGIIAGCILVGVPATGEYVIPAILGGGKTLMYGNIVADQFLEVGAWTVGSALAVAFMVALTFVLIVARRGTARREALL
jgi:spermidine/putrescine transport system permease protein